MRTKWNIWLVTGVCGFLVFLLPTNGDEELLQALTPEAAVEHLIALRHGLSFLDDENQALLDRVTKAPERHASALAIVLAKRLEEQMLTSLDEVHRLSRAIDLARQIGQPHTRESLHEFFHEATRSLASLRSAPHKNPRQAHSSVQRRLHNAALLRDQTLKVLSEFNDPYAVDICVESLETERNLMMEFVMLGYLVKVAPLRPDIRAKLEEMYNSPISPLRNHPQLLRVLEAVDRAEAEKKQIKADTNGEHRNDESDE